MGEPAALTQRAQVNIISMRADPSLKHPGRIREKTSLAKQGQLKVLHPLQGPCLGVPNKIQSVKRRSLEDSPRLRESKELDLGQV